jgi:hypothetical protein
MVLHAVKGRSEGRPAFAIIAAFVYGRRRILFAFLFAIFFAYPPRSDRASLGI